MIRDLEEVLNSVCDESIKKYLREALGCYNAGSYRACVIMSFIGGVFDLHLKVKKLASSNPKFRRLDHDIEMEKRKLIPYEKHLIEKCATEDFDMLNENERKALIRCMDIRNDCAHPSDFTCSAEDARQVFTTIIDLVASKPALLGQKHINIIINELKEEAFFPIKENSEMAKITENKLKLLYNRALEPLANKLVDMVINQNYNDLKNKENILAFLANMSNVTKGKFNEIINPIICTDKCDHDYLLILKYNSQIVELLSEENVKRTLEKFKKVITSDSIFIAMIYSVINNKFVYKDEYQQQILELLFGIESDISKTQEEFLLKIIRDTSVPYNLNEAIKAKFVNRFSENLHQGIPNNEFFQEMVLFCDKPEIYNGLCKKISADLSNYDYMVSNPATAVISGLNEKIVNKFSKEQLSKIMYSIVEGYSGYSHDIKNYMSDLASRYAFRRYMEIIENDFEIQDFMNLLDSNWDADSLEIFLKEVIKIKSDFTDKLFELSRQYLVSEVNEEKRGKCCRFLIILERALIDEDHKLKVQQIRRLCD